MADLARAIWGIPVVASDSERDLLYPTPARDQRVQIRSTGEAQRYTGTAWVSDHAGGLGGYYDVQAAATPAAADGTTNDRPAIAAADTAAQVLGQALLFRPGTYLVSTNLTIASPVVFLPGAMLKPANGVTITLSGPIIAPPTPIFTNAAAGLGTIAITLGTPDVLAEWWGATPTATTGTAVDCTAALKAALATGRNVQLQRGVYGFTGGLNVNAISQQLRGAGKSDAAMTTGTVLHKLSGVGYCVQVRQSENVVSDLTINGNGLAGSLLEVYAAKYSQFQRIALLNQGGTDFALWLYNAGVVNLCTFEDIWCGGSSTRFLKCENVLYCVFKNISCAVCEINIGDGVVPGAQAQALKFDGLYTDGQINVHDGATGIYFYGLTAEAYLAGPSLNISGATTQGVHVYGFRYFRASAGATPLVTVADAKNVRLSGVHWQVSEAVGQHLVELNDAQGFTIDGADVTNSNGNAFQLVRCVTALSGQVTVRDVVVHGGGAGSMLLWSSKPLVENVELDIAFVAGQQRGAFIRVSGAIDATNATGISLVDHGGMLTDPNKSVVLRTSTAGTEVSTPQWGEAVVVYSASMTPNAAKGRRQIITATNGVAFTINVPSNLIVGSEFTITLRNTSGGALGAATWTGYKMAAWTNPANGQSRSITFTYDGSTCIETSRTPADVPN